MPQLKHLLWPLAVLAMASAQSTSLPTTINADSTSAVQTSYTLTGTSIAAATGSPPSVASTTIHVASTVITPIPTASPNTTSTPSAQLSAQLSVPAIAGIAAAGSLLLIAALLLLIFTCLKRRRNRSNSSIWADLPSEKVYHPTARPLPRRPSSAATLVDAPAQAYVHSKGSLDFTPGAFALHHSRSAKSFKSSRSIVLERVSEEAANDFRFDFGVPPRVEVSPPLKSAVAQLNEDAFQRLVMDKSLPSSPEHEIPMTVLDLGDHQGKPGRPRSSVYSTATRHVQRDTWGGLMEGNSRQGYF